MKTVLYWFVLLNVNILFFILKDLAKVPRRVIRVYQHDWPKPKDTSVVKCVKSFQHLWM